MSEHTSARGPGRPSLFTDELAAEIIARLSNGEPLAVICRDEHMPCDDTVRNWAAKDGAFARGIARARETGFDVIAQRARLTLRGKVEEDGGESTGDVQRDKAIADFDLKLLAKWDPKRYGDRQQHEVTGADGGPIQYANMTREQRQARIAELEQRQRDRSGGA
jgi:hypothetical protein